MKNSLSELVSTRRSTVLSFPFRKALMKAHLHYGENRSKQVFFKEQKKKYFAFKKT